jgi:hypothetical protein
MPFNILLNFQHLNLLKKQFWYVLRVTNGGVCSSDAENIYFPLGAMTLGENRKIRLSNSNCIGVGRAVISTRRRFLLHSVWLWNGRAMCELLLFIAHRHAFQKANQPFTLESRPNILQQQPPRISFLRI